MNSWTLRSGVDLNPDWYTLSQTLTGLLGATVGTQVDERSVGQGLCLRTVCGIARIDDGTVGVVLVPSQRLGIPTTGP